MCPTCSAVTVGDRRSTPKKGRHALISTRRVSGGTGKLTLILYLLAVLLAAPSTAQFVDGFEEDTLRGWAYATGDGDAAIDMFATDGRATVVVDATADRDNIWWALIRTDVSSALDLERLQEPHHELRIEARVRPSHAPRRINLHLNTQRTLDFHSHLMEFDLPDTTEWHTISMTTRNFDARPGDTINGQLALIDWGRGIYRLEVDHFRVDVVDTTTAGPDAGEQVPYHPPIPPLSSFDHHQPAHENGMIDLRYPEIALGGWHAVGANGPEPVLTVNGTQRALLRWDLSAYAGRNVFAGGVLTLVTHSVHRVDTEVEEFGQIRISEILGGWADWKRETVTLDRFTEGAALDEVVNTQMIIDVRPAPSRGDTTLAVIPRPVLRRLVDGTTKGLMISPLGPLSASFLSIEMNSGVSAPTLHFSTEPASTDP